MSEEKKIFYKTLNNIVATNRIDNEETYIINNYVSGLENIIKEVREQINKDREKQYSDLEKKAFYCNKTNKLLEILDKVEENK